MGVEARGEGYSREELRSRAHMVAEELRPAGSRWRATSRSDISLAALRLGGVSGVRCFPRSQTEAGNNVSYRNPKERIHARPLYYGDNDDARNRPRSDIFRRRAT